MIGAFGVIFITVLASAFLAIWQAASDRRLAQKNGQNAAWDIHLMDNSFTMYVLSCLCLAACFYGTTAAFAWMAEPAMNLLLLQAIISLLAALGLWHLVARCEKLHRRRLRSWRKTR